MNRACRKTPLERPARRLRSSAHTGRSVDGEEQADRRYLKRAGWYAGTRLLQASLKIALMPVFGRPRVVVHTARSTVGAETSDRDHRAYVPRGDDPGGLQVGTTPRRDSSAGRRWETTACAPASRRSPSRSSHPRAFVASKPAAGD